MNASQANDASGGRILTALESSRQKQGISVAELARRIGVGKKRLWYILNGQRAMRADEFVKLCAFFNLGLGCFLDRKAIENLRSPNPKDGIVLDALRDLATSWAREHFSDYMLDLYAAYVPSTGIGTGKRYMNVLRAAA